MSGYVLLCHQEGLFRLTTMPAEIDQELWVLMRSSVPMTLDVDKQKGPGERVQDLDEGEAGHLARRYICQE